MNKKIKNKNKYTLSFLIILLIIILFFILIPLTNPKKETEGLMILIEFEGMEGLTNFSNELKNRDIPSLLIVSSEFVTQNCEELKKLQLQGVEIGGVFSTYPLWDKNYDEQFEIIKNTKNSIEKCTGEMRVFGSKYFAYDINTIKAAEKLGIEFVLARGTTGAKATIYKPIEYNVKLLSVSNVASKDWGTGSLCDYSYWAREGTPEDFEIELQTAAKNETKISPVSHTYIGGLKKRWNEIYLNFFDTTKINWMNLTEFGKIDQILPFIEIPQNREVQYTTPNPKIPLDEEENIKNVCAIN